jgi:hypothetical protein
VRQGANALLRRLRLAVPAVALALGPSQDDPLPAVKAESSARGPLVGLLAVLVLLAVGAAFAAARQRPRRGAAGPPMAPTRWLPPRVSAGRPDDVPRAEAEAATALGEAAPAARPNGVREQPTGDQEQAALSESSQGVVATHPSTCKGCGTEMAPGTGFCPTCGRAVT